MDTPPDLFIKNKEEDVCASRHGGAETSVQADGAVKKERDRQLIYGYIKEAGSYGHTLDELSVLLDRAPNRLSGRLTELRMRGKIVATGLTRKTRTGCKARVYRAIP